MISLSAPAVEAVHCLWIELNRLSPVLEGELAIGRDALPVSNNGFALVDTEAPGLFVQKVETVDSRLLD